MNRDQKIAWVVVGAFGLSVAVFVVLVTLVPLYAALAAFFGLFGLAGLGPILFRKPPAGDTVEADERDRIIARKSTLGGAMLSNLAVYLVCMTWWFLCRYQGKELITVNALTAVVFVSMIAFFTGRSVTLLVLYGRGRTTEGNRLEARRG
jgi:hypothetical protein